MPLNPARKPRHFLDILSQYDGDVSDYGNDSDSDDGDDDLYQPGQDPDDSSGTSDGDWSDSDDIPLAAVAGASNSKDQAADDHGYRWRQRNFVAPDLTFTGPEFAHPQTNEDGTLPTPLQSFRMFITEEMIELIVQYTNQYSLQKTGTSVNTNVKEIEQLLGIVMRMGLVEMAGIRFYWEAATRYAPIADVMPRHRCQLLLRTLHFVDNEKDDEERQNDKLWKIRPFLVMFRTQCLKIAAGEYQSIDEMMVPFKGSFSGIKQYMKAKPTKWGFKIWARCCTSGLLHDFDVYLGKAKDAKEKNPLGVCGGVVTKLCDTLPKQKNYKIYADNLFTSMALLGRLKQEGFQYTGTARKNRLSGCPVEGEKVIAKQGRGYSESFVETGSNIVCVRWVDTKVVTLMSTATGVEPQSQARRWDKKKKEYVEVPRPNVVRDYNEHMGGIDLNDSCISRYKFPLKSRRWYMYLFWHFVTLGVVNAWFLYLRESALLQKDKKTVRNLRNFQAELATGVIEVNTTRKRGRPSDVSPKPTNPPKQVRRPTNLDSRKDGLAHWPVKGEKRRRCALCVTVKTDMYCEKCKVPLCFTENRNCFRAYHTG
ncbi:Chimeric ERCC6-PGBD3 protein [Lamellibrachia satsuma]|nr:Chimeric ERCC6-PGBD3 protein [Lamellibrachia satsuma]